MTPQDLSEALATPLTASVPASHAHALHSAEAAPVDHYARFESWLRLWLPVTCTLSVAYTNNRSTLVSFRRSASHVDLRLHKLFAQAGPDVAQAVSCYVQGKKGHKEVLRRYLKAVELAGARRESRQPKSTRSQGAVHQLQPLFNRLNAQEFSGRCTSSITWGRSAPGGVRKRSITLGSYNVALNLIRIHPSLDQAFVPEYVVLGVVHHEMLHELLGIEERGGRRRIHPPEFTAIERMYRDHARCLAWERAHVGRLLAYRP